MQGPSSDSRHGQGIPIDKTLCVTMAPSVSVKTDGPVKHLDPLSVVGALDNEGLSLDIGETKSNATVMECRTGITAMIAEMHASDFNGIASKDYHGLLLYNKTPTWRRSLC